MTADPTPPPEPPEGRTSGTEMGRQDQVGYKALGEHGTACADQNDLLGHRCLFLSAIPIWSRKGFVKTRCESVA